MRLAIIGSRTCPPIDIAFYLPFVPDTIVSGGANGADTYAKEYAIKNNIPIIEFLSDYRKYGRNRLSNKFRQPIHFRFPYGV